MSSSSLDSIYGLNRLRITGMNSGFDTDSIISSIMKVEQMKVDKQFRSMTQKEYKRDNIRDVNKMLTDLRYEFMTSTGGKSAKNILSAMNFKGSKVTSDDTKNRATFSADTTAVYGSHTLNSVKQLAKGASMTSSEVVEGSGHIGSTGDTLRKLQLEGALGDLGLYTGSTDDEGYAVDADGNRYAINEDGKAVDADGNIVSGVDSEGKAILTGTLTINNVDIDYSAGDTLQSLINRVNSSEAGVTMGYSQLTDKFTLTNKATGKDSHLFASDTGGLLKSMGFAGNTDPVGGKFYAESAENGQDAIAYIDGIKVERSTNDFKIDGINYSLKKEFNAGFDGTAASSDGSDIGFEVSQDTDKAIGVIKDFVEGFNQMVAKLTSMIQEKPNSDYLPLTDEERDALSESQIEKWDNESKKGMLYKDSAVSQLLNDMRNAFFQEVEGTGLSLAEIGIAPGSSVIDGVYVGTQSSIEIDEDKLRKALEANPDRVAQMFNGGGARPEDKMASAGLGNRLIKLMNNYRDNTSDIQSASLDYEIDKLDDKIESMKDRMTTQEEMLYKKYAAMETALSKLQSQGNWFASQFA